MSNAVRATLALYLVLVVAACTPKLDEAHAAGDLALTVEPADTGPYK